MQRPNRRQFLWITGGLGGAFSFGAGARLLNHRSKNVQQAAEASFESKLQVATRTSRALGTEVSMSAWHDDQHQAEIALRAAFNELETVETLMSIYRPSSQLSRLNREGHLNDPHPYFVEVLRAAMDTARRSGGAFDVTVQPLWELYTTAQRAGRLPGDEEIAVARGQVDWRRVEISASTIQLRGRGTAITLNGIAQGYAADRAVAALRKHGIDHALVDTGEFGSIGGKADGNCWTIGIQHPRRIGAMISLAKLAGRCLATSGDYATSFTSDHRMNHLFDPRTGQSPPNLASVSVVADSSMQADALSTAVFVLGPDAGLSLVANTPGADALLVAKDGQTSVTDGFPIDSDAQVSVN